MLNTARAWLPRAISRWRDCVLELTPHLTKSGACDWVGGNLATAKQRLTKIRKGSIV